MPDDPTRYSAEELRGFRSTLGDALDRMSAEPYQGGEYERKVQLRETGISLHLRWTPKLPILAGKEPPHVCVENIAQIGLQPGLVWQLIDHLIELLEAPDGD